MLVAGKGTMLTFSTYYMVYTLDKHLAKMHCTKRQEKKVPLNTQAISDFLFVKEILEQS